MTISIQPSTVSPQQVQLAQCEVLRRAFMGHC
jgi:hypothetical protein